MANKMDDKMFKRLQELKALGLTDKVVSIRLGISERTVRVYTRAARNGTKPYEIPEEQSVPSDNSIEAAK
jgi:orotate phosphoribosyltransferase-like protein